MQPELLTWAWEGMKGADMAGWSPAPGHQQGLWVLQEQKRTAQTGTQKDALQTDMAGGNVPSPKAGAARTDHALWKEQRKSPWEDPHPEASSGIRFLP